MKLPSNAAGSKKSDKPSLKVRCFPECVAKSSGCLSWGSGGGGLFAGRFRVATHRTVYGESEKGWCVVTCGSAL